MSAVCFLFGLASPLAGAQPAPGGSAADSGTFEVVDISGQVNGELEGTSDEARESWKKACATWKNETKDLNKNNVTILAINCNQSTCSLVDASRWQCTSSGSYKVKTPGTRVTSVQPPPPVTPPPPPTQMVTVAPPPVVVEAVPPPQTGFVWVAGYWGWVGASHVWIPGRWVNERPGYVYVRENWVRRGGGWYFQPGRWDRRR